MKNTLINHPILENQFHQQNMESYSQTHNRNSSLRTITLELLRDRGTELQIVLTLYSITGSLSNDFLTSGRTYRFSKKVYM